MFAVKSQPNNHFSPAVPCVSFTVLRFTRLIAVSVLHAISHGDISHGLNVVFVILFYHRKFGTATNKGEKISSTSTKCFLQLSVLSVSSP